MTEDAIMLAVYLGGAVVAMFVIAAVDPFEAEDSPFGVVVGSFFWPLLLPFLLVGGAFLLVVLAGASVGQWWRGPPKRRADTERVQFRPLDPAPKP